MLGVVAVELQTCIESQTVGRETKRIREPEWGRAIGVAVNVVIRMAVAAEILANDPSGLLRGGGQVVRDTLGPQLRARASGFGRFESHIALMMYRSTLEYPG